MHIYIYRERDRYTYTYNIPTLIIIPPNKKQHWGGQIFLTINLDGGTITPS